MGVELLVFLQAVPAHRWDARLGGAVVFVFVLLAVVAWLKHASRRAELEHAEALIDERFAALEDDVPSAERSDPPVGSSRL